MAKKNFFVDGANSPNLLTNISGNNGKFLKLNSSGTAFEVSNETDQDLIVGGNLLVDGYTITINSEQVNIADRHLYLNAGYTATIAKTGGLVVNYLPTSSIADVNGPFTPGTIGVSNATVVKTNATTFSVGDFIQISNATEIGNNGIFEVLSDSGTLLTIRGVGTTNTIEDFTQRDFTASSDVNGTITKVSISVLRSGTDGIWEVAKGNSSGLTFTNLSTIEDIPTLAEVLIEGNITDGSNIIMSSGDQIQGESGNAIEIYADGSAIGTVYSFDDNYMQFYTNSGDDYLEWSDSQFNINFDSGAQTYQMGTGGADFYVYDGSSYTSYYNFNPGNLNASVSSGNSFTLNSGVFSTQTTGSVNVSNSGSTSNAPFTLQSDGLITINTINNTSSDISQNINIKTGNTVNANAGDLSVLGGTSSGSGDGGDINILGGNATGTGDGGYTVITGGNSNLGSGNGGQLDLLGGNASVTESGSFGGLINIYSGSGDTSGKINIRSGSAGIVSGDIDLKVGSGASTTGGSINLEAGNATTTGGSINLTSGTGTNNGYISLNDTVKITTETESSKADGYVLLWNETGDYNEYVDPSTFSLNIDFIQENVAVTGSGQTSFSLSNEPISKSSLIMFINQLKVELSNYSLSSSTVTYSGSLTLEVTDTVEFYYPTQI